MNLFNLFRKLSKKDQDCLDLSKLERCELHEDNIEFIPARSICGIRDRDNPHFWSHHGCTKESYLELARKSEKIYQKWNEGTSISDMLVDKDLKDVSDVYLSEAKIIQLYRCPNGWYKLGDDGRHRVAAAQELNMVVPARIVGEYK